MSQSKLPFKFLSVAADGPVTIVQLILRPGHLAKGVSPLAKWLAGMPCNRGGSKTARSLCTSTHSGVASRTHVAERVGPWVCRVWQPDREDVLVKTGGQTWQRVYPSGQTVSAYAL